MNFKGKRLMPTYLIEFLKDIYPGDIPANFGKRMVSRQLIAYLQQMYSFFGGKSIDNFGRDMCPEYLIKYLEYLINADYIEYEDDTVAYTKETPENALKYALLNYVGGMSYKENGVIKESLVTSVNSLALKNNDDKYGWGIDSTLYNYRDYINNKGHQVVGRVNLGDYDWNYNTTSGRERFSTNISGIAIPANNNSTIKLLINGNYNNVPFNTLANTSTDLLVAVGSTGNIIIRNFAYTDTDAFKSAMSGVYLYYELATESAEDIDPIDNVIDVSSGETTFNNEYEQDVPSSISYFIPNV